MGARFTANSCFDSFECYHDDMSEPSEKIIRTASTRSQSAVSNAPSLSAHAKCIEEDGSTVIHPSLHSTLIDEEHSNLPLISQDSKTSELQNVIPEISKLSERYDSMQREIETLKRRETLNMQSIASLTEQLDTLNPKLDELQNEKDELERKMEHLQNENRKLSMRNQTVSPSKSLPTNTDQEGDGLEWVPEVPEKIAQSNEWTFQFQPNKLGINSTNPREGIISEVIEGSQAQILGVKTGWKIISIEGTPYSEQILDDYMTKNEPFYMTFEDVKVEEHSDGMTKVTDMSAGATRSASVMHGELKQIELEAERTLRGNQDDFPPEVSSLAGRESDSEGERTVTDDQDETAPTLRSKKMMENDGLLDTTVLNTPTNGGGLEIAPKSEIRSKTPEVDIDEDSSVNSSLLQDCLS